MGLLNTRELAGFEFVIGVHSPTVTGVHSPTGGGFLVSLKDSLGNQMTVCLPPGTPQPKIGDVWPGPYIFPPCKTIKSKGPSSGAMRPLITAGMIQSPSGYAWTPEELEPQGTFPKPSINPYGPWQPGWGTPNAVTDEELDTLINRAEQGIPGLGRVNRRRGMGQLTPPANPTPGNFLPGMMPLNPATGQPYALGTAPSIDPTTGLPFPGQVQQASLPYVPPLALPPLPAYAPPPTAAPAAAPPPDQGMNMLMSMLMAPQQSDSGTTQQQLQQEQQTIAMHQQQRQQQAQQAAAAAAQQNAMLQSFLAPPPRPMAPPPPPPPPPSTPWAIIGAAAAAAAAATWWAHKKRRRSSSSSRPRSRWRSRRRY